MAQEAIPQTGALRAHTLAQQMLRQPFPTSKLHLLGGYKPMEKLPEARKQILSKEGSVVYLATAEEGMTMLQAIEEANARGLTLIPNNDIDERLNGEGKPWQVEKEFYPCWTGTLIVHAGLNNPFGKEISFRGLRVKIPKEWQHKKNCAIACNHPNFTIGEDGLITLKNAALIENFPANITGHFPEPKFGIPCGKPSSDEDPKKRIILFDFQSFVGLIHRHYNNGLIGDPYHSRYINTRHPSSGRLGVLAYTKPQTDEIQK